MSDFPYPGLRPFERDETDIFFGREELSNQLIERIGHTHFIAVVGLSGCGKSSLVRTGLLAGLEKGFLVKAGIHWRIAEFRPGNRPFANMAKALLDKEALGPEYTAHFEDKTEAPAFLKPALRRGPKSLEEVLTETPLPQNTNLLLVIDQFEELFRHYQRGDKDESAEFVRLLLTSSELPSVYVVMSMRSDFVGDCALFQGLPEAINQGLFLTPRLTREQLRLTIEGPAKVFGGQVEPKLVNTLLNDVGNDPDQLPVLQHALMRMWDRARPQGLDAIEHELRKLADTSSSKIIITLKHYQDIGELKNALSQHANEAYKEFDKEPNSEQRKKIAEILFRSLCERDSERRNTRRPVKLGEVATLAKNIPWQQVAEVVEKFRQAGRTFLMPPLGIDLEPDTVLDISHESLIRQWERLKKWTEKEAESADIYRRLEDNARRWEQGQTALLQTPDLENTLAWRDEVEPIAEWASRYKQHDAKAEKPQTPQEEKQQQQARFDLAMRFLNESVAWQRHLKRRKTLAIVGTIGFLVGVSLFLSWQYNIAVSAQQQAELSELQTERAKKSRTSSLFESQLTHATLLARGEGYVPANKISEDKKLDSDIVTERLQVRDLLAWFTKLMGSTSEQTYQNAGAPLLAVAVSPDAQRLVAAGENGTLVLFDVKSGQLLQRLQGHTGNVNAVVFQPQSQWFASAGDDKRIILWFQPTNDTKTVQKKSEWQAPGKIQALAVSPNGRYIASGGNDNNITLWDVQTKQSLQIFKGHEKAISNLAFSPNGELLASASYDGTARLWQIENSQTLQILDAHTDNVQDVAFSPSGKLLATGSRDKSVRLWNVESGKTKRMLLGHQNTVFGVRFVAEDRLVSASDDRTLRVWNTQYGVTMRILQEHTGGVMGITAHQGEIFSASKDGIVMRWNTALPYQQAVNLPNEPVSVAIAPDGNQVAVGFADGSLRLYALPKPKSPEKEPRLLLEPYLLWEEEKAHTRNVPSLTFNQSSSLLASVSVDGTAKVWKVKDNKLLEQQTFSHKKALNAVAFSPNGDTFAIAGSDGQVGLFTVGTRQKRFYQAHEGEAVKSVSYDASGTKLLSTSEYEVRLWNLNQWKNDKPELLQEYPKTKDKLAWSTFSPNGQLIASVGEDQLVRIYSTTSKYTEYSLEGHQDTIFRVIFADDQYVATVSADATLRWWDLHKKGRELFTLRLPTNSGHKPVPLQDFDFRCTPKGCWIAVPLTRGKLMLYEVAPKPESVAKPKPKDQQFMPIPIYRTGPYRIGGIAILGGFMDYMAMLNERDGGINRVKLNWEECETAYEVDRAIDCYERLKDKGAKGAAMFNFINTNATYAVMERAAKDQIPIVSIGYGRSDTADGKVFKYIFPLLTTYWNQNTVIIKFIGKQEGGMPKLKSKIIANVYHHSDYGKETISVLETQAKKYGFILKHFPITPPGIEQKSAWKQIDHLKPDWIILRTTIGMMSAVSLKEAKWIDFPADHIIGVWWSSDENMVSAGDAAIGYISTAFHPSGRHFKVIQDVLKYVYDKGKGHVEENHIGLIYYNRGITYGILNTEAIRTAQEKFGYKPLTGEQVQWGLEHLDLTEERLKELGAEGFLSPIKTSCADHEGSGKVIFQQWNGEKWNIISDWITPDYELTRPLVEAEAKKYADEHGITPRNCAEAE